MKTTTHRPEFKRDLQILHRYKNSIETLVKRLDKYNPDGAGRPMDTNLLVQILQTVRKHHYNKLHQIINRNVKPRPFTVGDVKQ